MELKKREIAFLIGDAAEDSTTLIEVSRSRFPFVDASFFRASGAPLLNRILTKSRTAIYFDVVSGKFPICLAAEAGLAGDDVVFSSATYPDEIQRQTRVQSVNISTTTTARLLTTATGRAFKIPAPLDPSASSQ